MVGLGTARFKALALEMLGLRNLLMVVTLVLVLELVLPSLRSLEEPDSDEVDENNLSGPLPTSLSLITLFTVMAFRSFICSWKST